MPIWFETPPVLVVCDVAIVRDASLPGCLRRRDGSRRLITRLFAMPRCFETPHFPVICDAAMIRDASLPVYVRGVRPTVLQGSVATFQNHPAACWALPRRSRITYTKSDEKISARILRKLEISGFSGFSRLWMTQWTDPSQPYLYGMCWVQHKQSREVWRRPRVTPRSARHSHIAPGPPI